MQGTGMSVGKRAIRVGDQLLREIADLLVKKVKDPRVRGTTLTGIRLTNDLKIARVYFSVMGDREDVLKAQKGLDSAKGFIKRGVGLRLELKYMPDIIFEHDPTLEIGDHMEKLFQRLNSPATTDNHE
jgi:ribosome-binding factor A